MCVCTHTTWYLKGLIISCFQRGVCVWWWWGCRPLLLIVQWPKWLYANASWPQCTLCLISVNMCVSVPACAVCVCYKIWLLRQYRIDELSSFIHTHPCTQTHTGFILRQSEGFVLRARPPFPPFKRHEICNGFSSVCVCVNVILCVCVIWCLFASVSVWFCIGVC